MCRRLTLVSPAPDGRAPRQSDITREVLLNLLKMGWLGFIRTFGAVRVDGPTPPDNTRLNSTVPPNSRYCCPSRDGSPDVAELTNRAAHFPLGHSSDCGVRLLGARTRGSVGELPGFRGRGDGGQAVLTGVGPSKRARGRN